MKINDPIERIVASALDHAGIKYTHESEGSFPLDFFLDDLRILIECKQFGSPRTERQIAPYDNVIVIQGREAANWFASLLSDPPVYGEGK